MKQTSYEGVKNWRHNTKIRLHQAFGGKCGCCGLVDEMVCYDFHHLGDEKKEFGLSDQIRSWAKVVEEAKKCCMLCALCHRKYHAGHLNLPKDMPKFDEFLIDKKVTHDACPVCSELKPIAQKTCSRSCGAKHRSVADWDKIDFAALLVRYRTPMGISRYLNVSDVAVRRQMRRRGWLK